MTGNCVLLLSGMVDQEGHFLPLVHWDLALLSEIFRREVLSLLRDHALLSDQRLALLRSWQHSGFHVHIGEPVDPRANRPALEGLARYMVRAPVRHAQLLVEASADPGTRWVDPEEDGRQETIRLRLQRPDVVTGETIQRLGAHELLARLSLHIPNPYQPLRFFYGAHSNHARHDREQLRTAVPSELDPRAPAAEPPAYRKGWRRRWAYLIERIYGENPLVCGHCGGEMKVLALITEPKQVDAILAFLRRYHPERLPGASQDLSAAYQARAGPGLAASPGEKTTSAGRIVSARGRISRHLATVVGAAG